MAYRVFTRTWWRRNPSWPDGREPALGRKTTINKVKTYDDAILACENYNSTHKPGFLSRKAEFEEIW